MSVPQPRGRLEVPLSLETQLHDFRRRVWKIKMLEAAGIAVFAVVVAFLSVARVDFKSSRSFLSNAWRVPAATLRFDTALFFLAAVFLAGAFLRVAFTGFAVLFFGVVFLAVGMVCSFQE